MLFNPKEVLDHFPYVSKNNDASKNDESQFGDTSEESKYGIVIRNYMVHFKYFKSAFLKIQECANKNSFPKSGHN